MSGLSLNAGSEIILPKEDQKECKMPMKMPMCKISGCREQAQPYGKRLCPEHEITRAAKAKAYRSKPLCQFCRTQHTNNENNQGVPECPSCRNARHDREFEQSKKNQIVDELMECSDLEELKEFIRYNLLRKE